MFRCCGNFHKGKFIYKFTKPFFRVIEYGECPNCGQKHFIDFKQTINGEDGFKEKIKTFKGKAAQVELKKWQTRLNNTNQGTLSKQYFYFGVFEKCGNYFKTYRTNFNNEKELISKQKTLIEKM